MKKILVFAPHPDDDVIGCGGSIIKHIADGDEVRSIYLTSGERARSSHPIAVTAEVREAEARNVARHLGTSATYFLGFPDTYLTVNAIAVERIVKLLRDLNPDWVYVTHPDESHHDHLTASLLIDKALGIAARPTAEAPAARPQRVLGYEVWTPIQRPNYIVGLTHDLLKAKVAGVRLHRSQIDNRPYDDLVEALARYRGITTSSMPYAEAFTVRLIREEVPCDDREWLK